MSAIFTIGERKKRPGVYQRYENNGTSLVSGASNGIVATVFQGNWGELNKVYTLSSINEVESTFGSGGETGTVQTIKDVFAGGASLVRVVRLGNGGTKGGIALKDTSATPLDAIILTARYEGSRAFSFTLDVASGDTATKEFVLYEGTNQIEKFKFSKGDTGEVDRLIAAASTSKYFSFSKKSEYIANKSLETVSSQKAITPGMDPVSVGSEGSAVLKDTSSTALNAIVLTARCVGSKTLSYDLVQESTTKVFTLYDGANPIEKFSFVSGTSGEVDRLITAASNSKYFSFSKNVDYVADKPLAPVLSKTQITSGADSSDYENAFALLEPYKFNTICMDSASPAVHTTLTEYAKKMFETGKSCFAVIGEPTSVGLETRKANAKAYNSFNVVYVGGGYVDTTGAKVEGYRAAAVIAGIIATVPSNQSITHYAISGAVDVTEMLTNTQYEDCIDSGMLVFSLSDTNTVWVDSGITTLNTLSGQDDEGWKKIKRTKIRFELIQRTNDTVAPLIGKVPSNLDGISNIIAVTQKVLDLMINEGKLLSGATVELDTTEPPAGDSAWFVITADDVDSIEKTYLTFKFRFAE